MLNEVSRHEDTWGSGGIDTRVLKLGARRRWVASFTPRSL